MPFSPENPSLNTHRASIKKGSRPPTERERITLLIAVTHSSPGLDLTSIPHRLSHGGARTMFLVCTCHYQALVCSPASLPNVVLPCAILVLVRSTSCLLPFEKIRSTTIVTLKRAEHNVRSWGRREVMNDWVAINLHIVLLQRIEITFIEVWSCIRITRMQVSSSPAPVRYTGLDFHFRFGRTGLARPINRLSGVRQDLWFGVKFG